MIDEDDRIMWPIPENSSFDRVSHHHGAAGELLESRCKRFDELVHHPSRASKYRKKRELGN